MLPIFPQSPRVSSITFFFFRGITILICFLSLTHNNICNARNRIITSDFKWSIASSSPTPNGKVDVYYYPDAEPLLIDILEILNDSYKRTLYLKKEPSARIPLFIYISQNDFEQSLIADVSEGTGGVTEAFKNRFIVGHTGSKRYLNHVISHEYTHVLENEILFGGWWKSARLVKFPFYPLWLMEGLSEYSSGDLDIPEREMLIRDAVINNQLPHLKHLHNFSHLEPNEIVLAYKTSEALMRFIAQEYGEDKLPLLLEIYKNSYDASSVIESVLGLSSIEDLDFRFREWYNELYSDEKYQDTTRAGGKPILTPKEKNNFGKNFKIKTHSPQILPDGKIIYISDKRGVNEIWLYNPITNKEKILVGAKNNLILDYISTDGKSLNLSSDGKLLAFIGEKKQKDSICIYEIPTGKLTTYHPPIDNYKSLASPYFYPTQNTKIIFTAMKGCQRDLFLYDISENKVEQLTNDTCDDTDSIPTPDGKYLIYSSERPKGKNFWDYDLFAMEISSRRTIQLTSWEWDERTPALSPTGKILVFKGEPDTTRNIYLIKDIDTLLAKLFRLPQEGENHPTWSPIENPNSPLIQKLTDTYGGCFDPVFSQGDESTILYTQYLKGSMNIYAINISSLTTTTSIQSDENKQLNLKTSTLPLSSSQLQQDDNYKPSPATSKILKRPYTFSASTDLFFPFIYYSSLDGLFLATYWQFSDMLARHNFQTGLLFSEYDKRLNYLVNYTYSRYRTQIFLSLSGDNLYYDYYNEEYARYDDITIGTSYPWDRFRRTDLSARTIFYKDFTTDANTSYRYHEDYINIFYIQDTSLRKYLETTSGNYLRTGAISGLDTFGGITRRISAIIEYKNWLEINPSLIFYSRLYNAMFLDGKDPVRYYLSGDGRVRGFPYKDEYTSEKILTATLAIKFPLSANINYYMWYLFPDFYFKTLTGELFLDGGIGEYNRTYQLSPILSSWGLSVKLYTFILQSYPLTFRLDWAKPFAPEPEIWYFKLSSYLPD